MQRKEKKQKVKVVNFKNFNKKGAGNQTGEIYKCVINQVIHKLDTHFQKRDRDPNVIQQLYDLWVTKIKEKNVPDLNIADIEFRDDPRTSPVEKQSTPKTTFNSVSDIDPLLLYKLKKKSQKSKLVKITKVGLDMPDISSITPLPVNNNCFNLDTVTRKKQPFHGCDELNKKREIRLKQVRLRRELGVKSFCVKPSGACTHSHNQKCVLQEVPYEVKDCISQNNTSNTDGSLHTVLVRLPDLLNESNRTCTIQIHNSLLIDNKAELILRPLINKVADFSVTEAAFILQDNITRATSHFNVVQADGFPENVNFRLLSQRSWLPFHKMNSNTETSDLDSGDDVTEDESTQAAFECENQILCQYKHISRKKNDYKLELTNGIMLIGDREYYFKTANGNISWC